MDAQQKRVEELDKENQLLEASPVKLPDKKPNDKQAVANSEIFFRPPQGIATNPDENVLGGLLYRYPGTSNCAFQDVLVAAVSSDQTEKFVRDVLAQVSGVSGTAKAKEVGLRSGRPLHFDSYHDEANSAGPYVCFFREPPYQVALIFRPAPHRPSGVNLETEIDYSLGSLYVGPSAALKHRTWKPPPRPKSSRKPRY